MKKKKEVRKKGIGFNLSKRERKNRIIIGSVFIILSFLIVVGYIFSQETPSNLNQVGCLSLTFDDGLKNHYDVVYPMLKGRGFNASFFVIANMETHESEEIMSFDNLLEMQENGFEIGSHSISHPYFTKLSESEAENELKNSKEILEKGGLEINSFAFPYMDYNEKLLRNANSYYLSVRDNYNFNHGGYLYNVISADREQDIDELCKRIVNAKEKNKWLILVMHKVSENPGRWDISSSDFNKLLDCAEESGIIVSGLRGCEEKTTGFASLRMPDSFYKLFYKSHKIGY